jgi:hypothetical protein
MMPSAMSVDEDAQACRLVGLAEQRHLVDGARLVHIALGIDHAHDQGMDDRLGGRREPLAQLVFAVFVHEEADGAAMHAVDRLACVHEVVQGLQHQAVAAECDDHIGLFGRRIAVAANQRVAREFSLGRRARHEGDAVAGNHGAVSVKAAARWPQEQRQVWTAR